MLVKEYEPESLFENSSTDAKFRHHLFMSRTDAQNGVNRIFKILWLLLRFSDWQKPTDDSK